MPSRKPHSWEDETNLQIYIFILLMLAEYFTSEWLQLLLESLKKITRGLQECNVLCLYEWFILAISKIYINLSDDVPIIIFPKTSTFDPSRKRATKRRSLRCLAIPCSKKVQKILKRRRPQTNNNKTIKWENKTNAEWRQKTKPKPKISGCEDCP